MDAVEFTPGNRKITPVRRATGEDDRVVLGPQIVDRDAGGVVGRAADVGVRAELGALGLHLAQAAVEDRLLHLELGDAVAEQAADAVGALEHHDLVACTRQLLRCREASGTGSDDGDLLAGAHGRNLRRDPAFFEGTVDDLDFDPLDCDRVLIDAEHTRRLTRRGTQAAGELGKVVRGVQPLDRVLPLLAEHEVVPVRDQVAERAAVVAERDTAVHAACRLSVQLVGRERFIDLLPVLEPHRHRAVLGVLTFELEKTGGLTHDQTLAASMILSTVAASSSPAASDCSMTVSTRL